MQAAMRTIIAISGLSLVVFTALVGKELVDDDDPPQHPPSIPAPTAKPQSIARPPPLVAHHEDFAAAKPSRPNEALFAALTQPSPHEMQRSLVIAELEKSGSEEAAFREQGYALGASLVAEGLASDYRCFSAGCYFAVAKPFAKGDEASIVRARDKHAPNALLAITGGAPPNKLVVLINYKEGS
jgi:hypothetical protein